MNLVLKLERLTASTASQLLGRAQGSIQRMGAHTFLVSQQHIQLSKSTTVSLEGDRAYVVSLTASRATPDYTDRSYPCQALPIGPEHDALESAFAHLDQVLTARRESLVDTGDPPAIDLDGPLLDHPPRFRCRAHKPG